MTDKFTKHLLRARVEILTAQKCFGFLDAEYEELDEIAERIEEMLSQKHEQD